MLLHFFFFFLLYSFSHRPEKLITTPPSAHTAQPSRNNNNKKKQQHNMQHMQKQQRRARVWDTEVRRGHRMLTGLLLRVCAPAQKPVHKLSIINMQNLCICVCVYVCVRLWKKGWIQASSKRPERQSTLKRKGKEWGREGEGSDGSSDMSKIKNSRRDSPERSSSSSSRNKWMLKTHTHDARHDVAKRRTCVRFRVASSHRRLTVWRNTNTFSFMRVLYGVLLLLLFHGGIAQIKPK